MAAGLEGEFSARILRVAVVDLPHHKAAGNGLPSEFATRLQLLPVAKGFWQDEPAPCR
jgi:hypothetical protein